MKTFAEKYIELESEIETKLVELIKTSGDISNHIALRECINISSFLEIYENEDYTELLINNNELTFINADGYHFSIWNEPVSVLVQLVDSLIKQSNI